jgi:putative ABC transport system permease protein
LKERRGVRRPPRLVEAVLAKLLPGDARGEAILGDLAEELSGTPIRYCVHGLGVALRLAFTGRRRRARKEGERMSGFSRDVKLGLRTLAVSPVSTAIMVLTLGLGIGANTAVFSMVDALVLRPFPIPDVDRLVMLWGTVPAQGEDRDRAAPADFLAWKEQSTVFERLVALEWWDVNLSGTGEPERLQGTFVSPDTLETFGVEPHIGRTLRADTEELGARTVVLSYQLFQRRFGGDPGIIGETIRLDGETYEVVGVAQEGFDYPYGSELWAPLWLDGETAARRDVHYLNVIGKLRPGVSVEDAQAELDVITARLEKEHPVTNDGRGLRAVPLGRAVIDEGSPAFLALWQAATVFVLLIACVNVTNLLLARGADREKEFSLQQALGAGRTRIVRQLLTENFLLAVAGALLALPLAWMGVDLLRSSLPTEVQRFVVGWREIDLDPRVLAFTAAVAILTTLVFGLAPALRASRSDLTAALREGGRGGSESRARQKGRRLLVMGEVALALMLLVASGLSIRGMLRLANGDHGYDPDGLMTFEIVLPDRKYDEPEKLREFYRTLLDGLRGTAGVISADLTIVLPSSGNNYSRSIDVEENRMANVSERPLAHFRVITPGYFETMRIPLLAGRPFGSGDREDTAPVAIVSRKFAERSWPSADPLGRRFRISDDEPWLTVVGVSGDVLHDWFLREPQPTYYLPFAQRPRAGMSLAIRTMGDPEAVTAAVRSQVRRADPDQPIFHAATMRQLISERLIGLRYAALVMAVLGLIGLVLSAVGIYGLMMYTVSRRTHEIGVRVALGAERGDVLRLALGQALSVTAAGVGIGLVLAYAAGRLMAANLFGVVRLEAATFALLALVLSAVSLLAAYIPARRALRVDPAAALRAE